ncbi:hypothetical protein KSP39_PZI006519 [Platanthera zijinensis]|uniref:SWIM-type domain-containing protein n=1 Tax=Platanthera zijinensis TaxID=2320716 RepID=A0AAP0BS06_9ASPA
MNENDRTDLYSGLMAENSLAVQELISSSALAVQELMCGNSLVVQDHSLVSTDHSLVVGQEFANVETCRRTLKDVAIALHFDLRIVKSDRSRFIAKCAKEGCPWRIHVAKCNGGPTFSIRTLHGEHTCEGVHNFHHQQASVGWVARSVEARVRDNPRRDEFKNTKLVNLFWNAVYSLTNTEFEARVAEMMEIQDVMPWFHQFPPNLWAVAYFEGVRYGHFTLGITEVLYNWALEGHELPIVQMMEHIRTQLTLWFVERLALGSSWPSILVPSAEKIILEAVADSHCYQVLRANKVEFEIVSSERTNIVDIQRRCCSCRRWQIFGIPCAHAAAALLSCGEDVRLYAQECFSVNKYLEAYSQNIYPLPDRTFWREFCEGAEGDSKADMIIRPPKTRRPPGRPKKKVLRIESLKRPKKVVQCGRCHLLGHSQKKCTMLA